MAAKEKEKPSYYRPVAGSRELATSVSGGDDTLRRLAEDSGSQEPAPLRPFRGEWLGGVGVARGVRVPESVFDGLARDQSPLEQIVYLHLFRLSFGERRNWCRAGKRELRLRCRVSDRRLNVALDGLVRKGHLKPLHRDTAGTLYRVFLPSEVLDLAPEPEITWGPKIGTMVRETARPGPEPTELTGKERGPSARVSADLRGRQKPLESPLNEERFSDVAGRKVQGPGVAQMAEWFFKARDKKARTQDRQMAITVLTSLLEDGFSREEIQAALAWFVTRLPEENSLDRLPYFIGKALEEAGGK